MIQGSINQATAIQHMDQFQSNDVCIEHTRLPFLSWSYSNSSDTIGLCWRSCHNSAGTDPVPYASGLPPILGRPRGSTIIPHAVVAPKVPPLGFRLTLIAGTSSVAAACLIRSYMGCVPIVPVFHFQGAQVFSHFLQQIKRWSAGGNAQTILVWEIPNF